MLKSQYKAKCFVHFFRIIVAVHRGFGFIEFQANFQAIFLHHNKQQ